jgi:hypothetical protein
MRTYWHNFRDDRPVTRTFTFSRQCEVCRKMHHAESHDSAAHALARVDENFRHVRTPQGTGKNICKPCWPVEQQQEVAA